MTTADIAGAYPVRFEVAYPQRMSRWLTFFRVLLMYPLIIALLALVGFIWLLYLIPWAAVLNDGRYPRFLLKPALWYQRFAARLSAYQYLLTDRFPIDEEDSPVDLQVEVPERVSRLTAFFRFLLLIPHYVVIALLSLALSVTTFIAWFAILFTGNYPEGLFRFAVGVLRWSTRVNVYMALLVDRYPPFSLD